MPSFKNALILTLGQVGVYGCSFLRNMILARTLSKADYGLASIFAITITMLELASRMSLGTQIIQSPHGTRHDFQNTSHTILAGVGLISGLTIFALAAPLAHLFGVPEATWAFMLLGVVPLFKGIEHLDNYRKRKKFNFTPSILSELIPQILVTVAAGPLAVWLQDYRAILWIIIGKAITTMVLTHAFASRTYRWAFKREYLRSMFSFGWPLILNGLLLFLSQQADQLIVGSFLTLEDVALYSASFSIAIIPFYFFGPILGSLFLPTLSKAQNDRKEFLLQYKRCLEASAIITVFLLSPLISSGEHVAILLFGESYHGTGAIIALLGITCAYRCFRVAPSTAAISRADTLNQLLSNIIRSSGVGFAICVAILYPNLVAISACALVAEIGATFYSIYRQKRILKIGIRTSFKSFLMLTTITLLATVPHFLPDKLSELQSYSYSAILIAIAVLLVCLLFPSTLSNLIQRLKMEISKTSPN